MRKKVYLIGQRFGKRLVIAEAPRKWGDKPFWRVRCDCGREDDILGAALRKGRANQCRHCNAQRLGSLSTTHGHSRPGKRTPTYRSWAAMRERCFCPTYHHWKTYGGRGITVVARWLGDQGFENFLLDMGERPVGKTLDRFPNMNGNYEPGNCRWATPKEQVANQRKHGLIEKFTDDELIAEVHRRGLY